MPNPISRTAYYTLGVRAADAADGAPICGDSYAKTFMNDDARRVWEEFASFAWPNASNAARHKMIDDHLRRVLARDPGATIVIVGAGFDTRAFRLTGGRWFEFDEPEIMGYKERCLSAASSPNPLTRVPVDFARESLGDKLSVVGSPANVHVVVEGVFMYLTAAQRRSLLDTLAARFPNHSLYCDLMSKPFFEKYSRDVHVKIVGMGATFTDMMQKPAELFTNAGYTVTDLASVPLHAAQRKNLGIPPLIVKYVMRTLREGYTIGVFRRAAS